ncbi:MAG TPA: hypothetical protein VFP97_01705 [Chitinophagaceae bacterium]|nr:hypothetical protein [Chitinophagaceae bacterium]
MVFKNLILNFRWCVEEKLLEARLGRAIFAILKNDVKTPHFKGWIGSFPDGYRDGRNADSNKWIGSSVG